MQIIKGEKIIITIGFFFHHLNRLMAYSADKMCVTVIFVTSFFIAASGSCDLNLTSRGYEEITPPPVDRKLLKMNLASNNLRNVTRGDFSIYDKLIYLNLSDNCITSLDDHAFEGLHGLQMLDLSGNPLRALKANAFTDMQLIHIYLESCELFWIGPDLFTGGLSHLKDLTLSRNLISYVPKKTFYALTYLVNLDISHNKIEVLASGMFNGSESIIKVDLGDNLLTEIPVGIFKGLPKLNYIILSNNPLTPRLVLEFSSLSPVFLSVDNCSLDQVPQVTSTSSSKNTIEISISGNQMNCKCDTFTGKVSEAGTTIFTCSDATSDGRDPTENICEIGKGNQMTSTVQPKGGNTHALNGDETTDCSKCELPNNGQHISVSVVVLAVLLMILIIVIIVQRRQLKKKRTIK